MKITISILGRFHFFDLAKQFEKKKLLCQLITSYPSFKAKEWSIKSSHVTSLWFVEVFRRVVKKTFFYNEIFNSNVKKFYGFLSGKLINKNTNIFIFFAGNGFNSKVVNQLKLKNVICIADEGSSHILYQRKILQNEYKKLGAEYISKQPKKLLEETLLEYQLADFIVVPSSFVKRSFIEFGIPENKLFHNPYGVDLSQFKKIKKEDKIFRVIYCGRLSLPKGSHYLLQAIYELKLKNFEFWHIGTINNEMSRFIEKYKSKKIIYKGPQPQSQLHKFYSQGSVFVMPSLQEGLAMVQPQAMACELPLICTTNTGGEEFISKDGEEGFVIPIRDVKALKQKILYLYENEDICKQMGIKARKKIESGFTWDDYGTRYINFLKTINKHSNNKFTNCTNQRK